METRMYKRRPGACESCKHQKTKCDGGKSTCRKCQASKITCYYPPGKKRGRRRQSLCSSFMSPISLQDTDDSLERQDDATNTFLDGVWSPEFFRNIDGQCETNSAGFDLLGDLAVQEALAVDATGRMTDALFTPGPIDGNLFESARNTHTHGVACVKGFFREFNRPDYANASVVSRLVANHADSRSIRTTLENPLSDILRCVFSTPQSPGFFPASDSPQDGDLDGLHESLALFSRHPYLGVSFIKKEQLRRFLQDVISDRTAKRASTALVYAAIVTGAKHQQRCDLETRETRGLPPEKYFEYAVYVLESSSGEDDFLTRFKAALTLLLYATQWHTTSVQRLLSRCIECVQILKLNSSSSISALSFDKEDELHLKAGFWLFYIIEKGHSVRNGQFSAISDECIDHTPPGLDRTTEHVENSFIRQCLFARLGSQAIQHMHGWASRSVSCHVQQDQQHYETGELESLLEAWKQEALAGRSSDYRPSAAHELSVHIDHYELFLYIHAERLSNPAETEPSRRSKEMLAQLSQDILRLIGHMDTLKIVDNWRIIKVCTLAFCSAACLFGTAPEKLALRQYMSLALGLFARVSMASSLPFENFNEVVAEVFRYDGTVARH